MQRGATWLTGSASGRLHVPALGWRTTAPSTPSHSDRFGPTVAASGGDIPPAARSSQCCGSGSLEGAACRGSCLPEAYWRLSKEHCARARPHCACVFRPISARAFWAQQCACVPFRETAVRLRGSRAGQRALLRMRPAVGGQRPCAEPRALSLRGGRCLTPLRAPEGSSAAELCGEAKRFESLRLLGSALSDSQERSRPKVNVILLYIGSGCSAVSHCG